MRIKPQRHFELRILETHVFNDCYLNSEFNKFKKYII